MFGTKYLETLAPLVTTCPDHLLLTKSRPLVLDLAAGKVEGTAHGTVAHPRPQFEAARKDHLAHYERCKHENSPAVRDPNPVIILYPGVGMFAVAKDKQ